jgi:SOS response associated peptidase (SRAP)
MCAIIHAPIHIVKGEIDEMGEDGMGNGYGAGLWSGLLETSNVQLALGLAGWLRLSYAGMCGRFARRSTQEVLADRFGVEIEEMPWFAPTFNAAPQSTQPVIRINADSGKREFALMRWG